MKRTFLHALAFAVSLGIATMPARTAAAAPDGETRVQREAREAFAAGERAFSQGDYPTVLREFERTFRLVPHDAVRFNIGVCLERLQRYRDALAQYQGAIESQSLSAKERQRAREFAERVRRELGTLIVNGAPAGAPVAINGEARCNLPCRIELDPGAYTVAVADAPARDVRIDRGAQLTVDASAEPRPAAPIVPPTPAPAGALSESPGAERPERDHRRGGGPGWLTWVGGSIALAGTAGLVGFGLHTQSLHDRYTAPGRATQALKDDGDTAVLLTNLSIGVAAVGAALVALDLLVLAPNRSR